jgi:hypothetical protein
MGQSATVHQLRAADRCRCRFGRNAEHHDRLLRIDHDPEQIVSLMELALTWGELDYSDEPVIPPNRWLDFVAAHSWIDQAQAERIVGLALDVARGATRGSRAHALNSPSAR